MPRVDRPNAWGQYGYHQPPMENHRARPDLAMNGDIIEFNGKPHEVIIQGREGVYVEDEDGYAVNVAQADEGYLRELDTNREFRAKWTSSNKIIQRKYPFMFGANKS